mmetsp:Transcript_9515/g.21824  ORF Transcript_9515/g.21824 Transcript_9515/m.21824 type:complete len:322 (-) Transcript_9515:34-999(-)
MGARRKDHVGRDPVHVHESTSLQVVKVDIAELRDEEDDSELLTDLHGNRKVSGGLRREVDLHQALLESGSGVVTLGNLNHMHLSAVCALGGKREQSRLLRCTLNLELGKSGGMTLNGLADLLVHRVQLHCTNNARRSAALATRLSNANKDKPLLIVVSAVVDDLCVGQAGVTVEHLFRGSSAFHRPMVHSTSSDKGQSVGRHPFPEHHRLAHLMRLGLGAHFDVEDLEMVAGFQGQDLRHGVHQRTVRGDGPLSHCLRVGSFDDADVDCLTDLLADANVFVRLHRRICKCDAGLVNAQRREVEHLLEADRKVRTTGSHGEQ